MSKILLTGLLGLILFAGFGFFLREGTDIDCDLVNTALFIEVPKQTLGFPRVALTRHLSEQSCNIDNQGKILWDSWDVDTSGLIIDVTLWLAAAALFVYGAFFANNRLLHMRRDRA